MSDGREDYDVRIIAARDALLGSLADLHNASLRCRYEGLHAMPEDGVLALPDEEGMVRLYESLDHLSHALSDARRAWSATTDAGKSWSIVRHRPYWDPMQLMTEEARR
jgi:hypothetical protein